MALRYETKMTWKSAKFDQAIRDGQYYQWRFGQRELNFDWERCLRLLDTHMKNRIGGNVRKNNFQLLDTHKRGSIPKQLKEMVAQLEEKFYKNKVTLICFGSIGPNSKSFNIHRDTMDVIYMQGLGEVDLSIWEGVEGAKLVDNLDYGDRSSVRQIFKKRFKKYDIIWIPRGTYHLIEPVGSRVGFSFGIEDTDINPKDYI